MLHLVDFNNAFGQVIFELGHVNKVLVERASVVLLSRRFKTRFRPVRDPKPMFPTDAKLHCSYLNNTEQKERRRRRPFNGLLKRL
jgi:hypothetical protein